MKIKLILSTIIIAAFASSTSHSLAAPLPKNTYAFNFDEMTAQAYLVVDKVSGQVLLEKNADTARVPASLTKLITAMVVLDMNPTLKGTVTMAKSDEVGGTRIATRAGVKYSVKGLFFTSLIASANNATNALARSTGLTREEFVKRMNEKAISLGAVNTVFVEPTGMDPASKITARDFSKIAVAAFHLPLIHEADNLTAYNLYSTGSGRKYVHRLKTTNRLLSDGGFLVVGAKTGYLDESRYNFVAELKDVDGKNILVVVLGSKNSTAQFFETKKLAIWAWSNYSWKNFGGQVAGATSQGLQMPVF